MGEKLLICHYCNVKFPSSELIQVNKTKRSCKACYQSKEDYKELIDYICKGFGQKAPTGKQMKDIKKFKELGLTYKEIQWTLYYIFCVANKKIEDNNIGLVPYFHKEAMEHFTIIQKVKENSKDIELQEEITIVKKSCNSNRNVKKERTRYVNIKEIY